MKRVILNIGLLAVLAAANACGGGSGGNGPPSGSGALGGTTNSTCTLDAMSGTDTELAPLNGNGALVAVDSTYVYFTQADAVLASPDLLRVARTGGASEVLTHLDYVANMLVDANSIYIRTYDGISKVSTTGGSSTSFASIDSIGLGAWLAQDATHVYAIDDDTLCEGDGAIYAFDKQTGAKTTIAGNFEVSRSPGIGQQLRVLRGAGRGCRHRHSAHARAASRRYPHTACADIGRLECWNCAEWLVRVLCRRH